DGKKVYEGKLNGLNESKIAEMMVGRELSQVYPMKPRRIEEVIFEIKDLSTVDGKVRNVSFKLFRGEILGFYGLVGSGRTEVMESIIGLRKNKKWECFA
ncbi:MAG: sugar ABC transporter ATP-binding protein, partial [Fervidobacterium sp.]